MTEFQQDVIAYLRLAFGKSAQNATVLEWYEALSKAAMAKVGKSWGEAREKKRVCYFSAEFLMGRMLTNNLLNLGLLSQCDELLSQSGLSVNVFEELEDPALGNGGLGRLAACFLDSAATQGVALDGFGIRYQYGLFRQTIEDGFQKETADDWQRCGDPFSVRREDEAKPVRFADMTVLAVPYDMPVVGLGGRLINTLRLWQSEPVTPFDFARFNGQRYRQAVKDRDKAQEITYVLYPNDDGEKGKRLRLRQQYFFCSASLQCIVERYKRRHGGDFAHFSREYAVQLNDTHPVVSIPELLRILMAEEGLDFETAFRVAQETFSYTNHTVMAEAMEKWDEKLFCSVIPEVYPYVLLLQNALRRELCERGIDAREQKHYDIIEDSVIHMARLAVFAAHATNGVAALHTRLLKTRVMRRWYELYPRRFQNKTNGITQRRWLMLCNPELSEFITERIGEGWKTDLSKLKALEAFKNDRLTLRRLREIKQQKKQQLARYVKEREGVLLRTDFLFDVQAKRLHEYKRQLLGAFSILDTYFGLKEGRITEFSPTAYLFAAKAAPGYYRAKAVIKYINEIARKINGDPAVQDKMQVLFLSNYNVSYAEKIIPAADVSQQISTVGTEASGTGNMKFMLNGAVTLGTYDGANIEIAQQAGEENNYLFGLREEEFSRRIQGYEPKALYLREPRLQAVLNTLVDGTFDDGGTGMFRELYDSLLEGSPLDPPDRYYVLGDFLAYCDARQRANADYADEVGFSRKCLMNIAGAGWFSSDRTILEYAREIWGCGGEEG